MSKLKLVITAVFIALSVLVSAYADILTQSKIDWNPGLTPELGGTATVHYDDGDGGLNGAFQVDVAPFELSMATPNYSTPDWITPQIGSGIWFGGVTLHSVDGEHKDVFATSMGLGFRNPTTIVWDGGNIQFLNYFQWWDVTFPPVEGTNLPPVSTVPEPQYTMLVGFGLIMAIVQRRRKNPQCEPSVHTHELSDQS